MSFSEYLKESILEGSKISEDTMMYCIPCGWEGKYSEMIKPKDGGKRKCPKCGSTNVIPKAEWESKNKKK